MDHVKRIWCLSPMRAAKVQASLRIRAVSPEPPLLAHTSSESRGTFILKARSLTPLNGWGCTVKVCHDGMVEDTNSLDGAQMSKTFSTMPVKERIHFTYLISKVRQTLNNVPKTAYTVFICIKLSSVHLYRSGPSCSKHR